MSNFRDALRPLAANSREHNVLHIAADLDVGDKSFFSAINEILCWARVRNGRAFPPEAMDQHTFESLNAGRSTAAVRLPLSEADIWAIRQEDPDKSVPGRVWTVEAVVWRSGSRTQVAVRSICGTSEAGFVPPVATPGFMRQLVKNVGVYSNGFRLTDTASFVQKEDEFEDFLDLLNEPKRRVPIVTFSLNQSSTLRPKVDVQNFAEKLCGLACVYVLSDEFCWELTKRLGKRLSVFDGAVRVYMPRFDYTDDPYAHPLHLPQNINIDLLASHIAQSSIHSVRLGRDIVPFSRLRSDYLKLRQSQAETAGANSDVQLQIALQRIESLEKEVKEAKDLEALALENSEKADLVAKEARDNARTARVYAEGLLLQLKAQGQDPDSSTILPKAWEDFEEWCDRQFVARLILTRAARRGCRKAEFGDVQLAARCIVWLANECRTRFIEGGGSVRDEQVENGIRNAPCGGDEYDFFWDGRKLFANWHVKNGGNTREPRYCLRIYYTWDEETKQIIVSDMPDHKITDAT